MRYPYCLPRYNSTYSHSLKDVITSRSTRFITLSSSTSRYFYTRLCPVQSVHRRQYFQTTRLYANKAPGPSSSNHGGSVDDVSQAVSATSSRTGSRKPEVKEKEEKDIDGRSLENMLSMGTFLELNVCIDRYPRWVSSHDLLRCGKHVLYKCSCPMVRA